MKALGGYCRALGLGRALGAGLDHRAERGHMCPISCQTGLNQG